MEIKEAEWLKARCNATWIITGWYNEGVLSEERALNLFSAIQDDNSRLGQFLISLNLDENGRAINIKNMGGVD